MDLEKEIGNNDKIVFSKIKNRDVQIYECMSLFFEPTSLLNFKYTMLDIKFFV